MPGVKVTHLRVAPRTGRQSGRRPDSGRNPREPNQRFAMTVAEPLHLTERMARPADRQQDQGHVRPGDRGSNVAIDWCSFVSIQISSFSPSAFLNASWAARRQVPPISAILRPPSNRRASLTSAVGS